MQLDAKNTIFVIDGSSFLYRAYYGVRPLHTKAGVPVQAVYSFCRMIKKLVQTFAPTRMVLVWDSKGKTTRHQLFPDYKATRQAPPSDIFDQKELIIRFADLIGLKQIAVPGIEADDIIYSVAQEQKKEGITVVMITSDKDMGQALDDQVLMYDAFKEEFVSKDSFEAKRGFPVGKIPFYFAILGDTSDNIPGVKGIGEKGALELVTHYESLDDLYARIDSVSKPRMRQALIDNKDNAYLSYQLFLLQYHPTGLSGSDVLYNSARWSDAKSLFAELEFTSFLKEIAKEDMVVQLPNQEAAAVVAKYDYRAVTTIEDLEQMISNLKEAGVFALDTETDGLSPLQANLVGLSLCCTQGIAYYIPVGHVTQDVQLPKELVIAKLKPLLEDSALKKYMHNAKFDCEVLFAHGIHVRGLAFDTMVAASLVLKEWQSVGLKSLSEYYLQEPMISFQEIVKDKKLKNFSYVSVDNATAYAAADAHQTFRLYPILRDELAREGLTGLYDQLEGPLVDILIDMEERGIRVDASILSRLNNQITADLDSIKQQILALIGPKNAGINFNSPRQIEQLLFTDLGLPPQKKSAKGTGYSTDQEVLEILAAMHPVPGLILKYRELTKLKTTYIQALPDYINLRTGKIHTSYNQVAVATGRLASSEPNLQNIPTNSGYGLDIRGAFIPEEGSVFISADYSQIELRVLAHLSQDEHLKQAFLTGQDIHAQTAARLFDVTLEQVTSAQRQLGKRINFSILYGLTPYGLSKDLNIPFKDAKMYIEKYFQQYPGVTQWMEEVVQETKHHGYVTTHWGRKRYVPAIYERNRSLYEEGRRVAINTKAQGTAAELMKFGMINLNNRLVKEFPQAHMILQIHDELLIMAPQGQAEQVAALTKDVLEQVVSWSIPLEVGLRIGATWKEVTK